MSDVATELFPRVKRVVYQRNPLVEVICQVRFPPDLRVDAAPPADFQQLIRHDLPLHQQQADTQLTALPPDLAKALKGLVPPPSSAMTWKFRPEDGSRELTLHKDRLTQSTETYSRWEPFFEAFGSPVRALNQVYAPPFYTRIGLRYRDLILRSDGISEQSRNQSRFSSYQKESVNARTSSTRFKDEDDGAAKECSPGTD